MIQNPMQKPRYRFLTPKAPTVPNPITEPQNPTGMVGGPAPITEPPNSAGMPLPQTPAVKSPALGAGGDPVAPPGQPGGGRTPGQVSGLAPRPPARPQVGAPPVAPPPPPPAPPAIVEPPNPVGGVDGAVEGSLTEQAFLPGGDGRLQGAQGATDKAMARIQGGQNYSGRAAGNEGRYRSVFGTAEDSGKYMAEQDAAVAGLGGPSRTDLAKQALADFERQGETALQQRFRAVGQKNAALGRLGSGMVNSELGTIQGDFERDRLEKMNELARSVSEGDISDRFRRVDATSGLRRGEAGISQGLRGENFERQRSAIDYGGRDASQDIGNEYGELDAAGRLEDRVFGQGQQNRGEFRAERGYQDSRRRESLDNRIRQREMENAEQRERAIRAQLLLQAGGRAPSLDDLLRAG